MMGVWFLAAAGAALISSSVASLAAVDPGISADKAPAAALALYIQLFYWLGAILAGSGALLLVLRGALMRLIEAEDAA